MDITPRTEASVALIQQYGPEGFIINGEKYEHSVIVGRERVDALEVTEFTQLTDGMIREAALAHAGIDILLIGSGASQEFLPPSRRGLLKAQQLVIECMDTGAACRTFNILQAEDRNVAAILIKP